MLLAGCGHNDISTNRIAKDKEAAPTPPQISSGLSPGEAQVKWKLPSGWEELPPAQMRVGSFRIKGKDGKWAEVSIVPLGGMAGGTLGNVNRWRSQVGLGPVQENELPKLAEKVEIGGQPAQLFDMAGVPPEENEKQRILAALLSRNDTTWFFKMTGADALVQQQKASFIGFLKDISFPSGSVGAGNMAAGGPVPLPPTDVTANSAQGPIAKPSWTVPAGWQERPAGMMQVAKFAVAGDKGKAEVSVAAFPGETGGTLANVNRWRKQLGLEPVDEAALSKLTTPLDLSGTKALLVDMANPADSNHLIAAIVPRNGNTWFYKILGNDSVVAEQKAAFVEFVRSAK